MAGFKTHMTISSLAGIAYGGAAYGLYQVPAPTCALAGGLCAVSGMLPDIDSGPGKPLRESLSFAAAVVCTMLVERFQTFGWATESIILAAAAVYLAIRFGLSALLKLFTVHRGMFHSIPAAVIAGEIAFLLASGTLYLRGYTAGGVVVGYLSHLILDELYSVQYVRGRMKLKKSFGTGLKLFRKGLWANLSTYSILALVTFLACKEPGWMETFYETRLQQTAEEWAEEIADYSGQALARLPGWNARNDMDRPGQATTNLAPVPDGTPAYPPNSAPDDVPSRPPVRARSGFFR